MTRPASLAMPGKSLRDGQPHADLSAPSVVQAADALVVRTVVRAPVNGYVTNLGLVVGQYAVVGTKVRGHVESISHGITDRDNVDGPELLANVNPTFGWVRLAHRIPVRIHIDEVPEPRTHQLWHDVHRCFGRTASRMGNHFLIEKRICTADLSGQDSITHTQTFQSNNLSNL